MAAILEFDPLLNRKIRTEGWAGQGRSSLAEVRDALEAGDGARAIELLDCYLWETRLLYVGYLAWLRDWVAKIGEREQAGLWVYLERAHAHAGAFGIIDLPSEIADEATANPAHAIALVARDGGSALSSGEALLPVSPWLEVGQAERAALEKAIGGGAWDEARRRLEALHWLHKPYHDVYSDWLWLWMTMLAQAWGEDAMIALIADSGLRLRTAGLDMLPSIPVERQVMHLAAAMRGHRSGPGEEGDIRVLEDDEKFVIEFDACGSGGRMRRQGAIDGLPARQDAPFRFGTTSAAHPMGWGRTNVPYYCLHCAAYAEMQSVDQIGYPSRVTLFNPDHSKPCAWAFYKRPEDTPQEYFDRIGKRRDPKRFVRK